jgi:sulfur-oxidizing protein SoxY
MHGASRPTHSSVINRRDMLAGAGSLSLAPLLGAPELAAAPADFEAAMAGVVKGRAILAGRIKLEVPELAENGNAVSVTIAVDSPMIESDHVRTVHILAERNPIPLLARIHLGPRAGRAFVSTRVRLADSQPITVLAEMSDGSIWSATANVVVTIAACLDGG